MFRLNVIIILLVGWEFVLTNSRTSTFWKLDNGKITVPAPRTNDPKIAQNGIHILADELDRFHLGGQDETFYIIASTMINPKGWIRKSPDSTLNYLLSTIKTAKRENDGSLYKTNNTTSKHNYKAQYMNDDDSGFIQLDETLECGEPVNSTYYDYLIGVGQRFNHPIDPEPEVAYYFLETVDEDSLKTFDINALEYRLKKDKRDNARNVQLYTQIGNYWRIIGDTRQAIECFRRALSMSPYNADVLLSLARVLYHLQYLDDAIHLTRRSIELITPGRSAWQQYFTLGEIFKSYGHFQESILHFRHALDLNPDHEPILKALRDVENSPPSTLHVYTIVIIIALVVAVVIVILTSSTTIGSIGGSTSSASDNNTNTNKSNNHNMSNNNVNSNNGGGNHQWTPADFEGKQPRHFNRAMAMRSLKGFRNFRHRRHY